MSAQHFQLRSGEPRRGAGGARLRGVIFAVCVLFVVVQFVLVAAPVTWTPISARVRAVLAGPMPDRSGWPPMEEVFVVTGADSPRLVRPESGTFEDWELPLASRTHAIYGVRVTGASRLRGVWSPVAYTESRELVVTVIATGTAADGAGRELAVRVYGDDCRGRGVSVERMAMLETWGRFAATRVLWRGVTNDAMVLAALVGCVVFRPSVREWRRRRVERLLGRGICPGCGYAVLGLAKCPECGAGTRLEKGIE